MISQGERSAMALAREHERAMIDSARSQVKVLLKDGVWQVPQKERPAGWQKMGGREPRKGNV